MIFIPKKNKSNPIVASVLLAIAVIAAFLSRLFLYPTVAQIVALAVFSLALWTVVRFVMPRYEYELTDTELTVRRITGTRCETLGCMTLTAGIAIVKSPATAEEKAAFVSTFGKTDNRFNFCANIRADQYVYVTEFASKRIEVLLECDEAFAAEIRKRISACRSSGDGFYRFE
ncbi:MAG: hypothetical protein MJ101_03495 [Clostridia bacterium]|nr:hypothetical protein [Clostridia bacterium]